MPNIMMNLTRLPHYFKKIWELGPRNSLHVAKNRLESAWHEKRLRHKAQTGTAAHSWQEIACKHGIEQSFSQFWQHYANKTFSFLDQLHTPQVNELIQQADLFEQKIFDLLGSGPVRFEQIPWHSDFRLHAQDREADHFFDKYAFYKDIQVQPGTGEKLVKDIKVPWELSRFQHLFVLGQAYQITQDERYVRAFVEHVGDWQRENPYLLGANWVCPMDVGIRAINWLCAFHFFKDADIPESFWQSFFCSLYDHFVYLENNWEIYDGRTSNHYLSDLVGYLYLCYFFDSLIGIEHKMVACQQSIMHELQKQVGDDGTDYEGSTKYHALVTELFLHAYLIAHEAELPFTQEYGDKLNRMLTFAAYTKNIQIGDNDSGKIIYYGLPSSPLEAAQSKGKVVSFSDFGLSCLTSHRWNMSLRHHVYSKRQPSGHFHNDVGSITLALDDIPIIVDPGSYLYTPSVYWRNYFRSVDQHSTFYLDGREPVSLDERLFALDIPEQQKMESCEGFAISHGLYSTVTAHREIEYLEQRVSVTDWWDGKPGMMYATVWNFIVAPEIRIEKKGDTFLLCRGDKRLAEIISDIDFVIQDSWFSEQYGVKIPCKKLRGQSSIASQQKVRTMFKLI